MKHRIMQYLPHLNQQTLMVIYILLAVIAMAIAGGAPGGEYGAIGS